MEQITRTPALVLACANTDTAVVYRSPLVRDTDTLYAPVADFLKTHNARLFWTDEVRDTSMMQYRAKLAVYEIDEAA